MSLLIRGGVRKRLLVGIAGGSGAGKTFFASKLVEVLGVENASSIGFDNYYHDLSRLSAGEIGNWNFDRPEAIDFKLLKKDLRTLREGRSLHLPEYDFSSRKRSSSSRKIEARKVFLFEGILALCDDEICGLYDLSVYLDVPADIRLIRRIRRDIAERGFSLSGILEQYERSVRPMHKKFIEPSKAKANIVLNMEEMSTEQAVTRIAAIVRERVDLP